MSWFASQNSKYKVVLINLLTCNWGSFLFTFLWDNFGHAANYCVQFPFNHLQRNFEIVNHFQLRETAAASEVYEFLFRVQQIFSDQPNGCNGFRTNSKLCTQFPLIILSIEEINTKKLHVRNYLTRNTRIFSRVHDTSILWISGNSLIFHDSYHSFCNPKEIHQLSFMTIGSSIRKFPGTCS